MECLTELLRPKKTNINYIAGLCLGFRELLLESNSVTVTIVMEVIEVTVQMQPLPDDRLGEGHTGGYLQLTNIVTLS